MKTIFITIIKLYKYMISPIIPASCRFVPTCSEYAVEAIQKYGALKGTYISLLRIVRCNPFYPGGFDPVK